MKVGELYIFITFVITLCTLSSCSSSSGSQTAPGSTPQLTVSEALIQADSFFAERNDLEKLRKATYTLAAVRNPENRNFEVEWKYSKFNYFLGLHTQDSAEAERSFESGRDAGRIASRVDPSKPDGYFWFGANQGELAKRSPITVGLKSIDDIREAMTKVVEINPAYQNGSAYDALGQLELQTRLYGGKADKAVEYLEKGLAIDKENANIRVHLAEAYLAVKRDIDARRQIDQLMQMKPNPDYLQEHEAAVAKAKKLLATNF